MEIEVLRQIAWRTVTIQSADNFVLGESLSATFTEVSLRKKTWDDKIAMFFFLWENLKKSPCSNLMAVFFLFLGANVFF